MLLAVDPALVRESSYEVLAVVGDSGTPSTADQEILDWLATVTGANVTVDDDSAAEKDTTDGYDVVVVCPSASVGTKYRGDGSNPLPCFDMGPSQELRKRFSYSSISFNFQDTIRFADDTVIAWSETVDTDVVVFDGADNANGFSTIPAAAHIVAYDDSGETHGALWLFDAGDTMADSVVTDVRIACYGAMTNAADSGLNAANLELCTLVLDWVRS